MDAFNLNKIPKVNFLFEFKLPSGYFPFGYNRNTLQFNIFNKFKNENDKPYTIYTSSIENPGNFSQIESSQFVNFITETIKNTNKVLLHEIEHNINPNEFYLIVMESFAYNNLFQYYTTDDFKIENILSPKLLDLLKNNQNFKLVFMDIREGAYHHPIELVDKIYNFLEKNKIYHKNKVLISSNNNFIKKLQDTTQFKKYNNYINLYPNNYFLLTAGKFIGQLKYLNNSFFENDYTFSIQDNINTAKEKYFLMYNRNSERMHRPYFVNELYKNNLIEKGFISFFENPYLDDFLNKSNCYSQLGFGLDDINSIKENYKKFTPLVIDNSDAEEVANYHNFLSRKDEYEKSYFTIISETNAESEFCFITEKTMKPIMNLHPFVVLGNPHTLKVLKSYGFKTFDKWWDESYDDEFDFKKRASMILEIVKTLCNYSFSEWNIILSEMEETLIYNKNLLHKLWYNKEFQKEFLKKIIESEKTLV